MAKSDENRRTVYSTKVNIDLDVLREIIPQLKQSFEALGGKKETQPQRSAFSVWNNINTFYNRVNNGQSSIILDVDGTVSGNSARIYHKPSVTSYAKVFRKAIKPIDPSHKFLFFDLSAAEFVMNCIFCGESEAVRSYQAGEDIYMYYAPIFPKDTPRKIIKEVLISNMYGATPYSTAKRLGISEYQAEQLLRLVQKKLYKMEHHKSKVIVYARRMNGYFCPNGFNQSELVKVADIDPVKGFSENLALSAYVQSALGLWMQELSATVSKKVPTYLSVFDSCLVEINPAKQERIIEWFRKRIAPFRTSKFTIGDTFFEAYMSE